MDKYWRLVAGLEKYKAAARHVPAVIHQEWESSWSSKDWDENGTKTTEANWFIWRTSARTS